VYGRAVRREKSGVGTYLYVIARSVAADVRKRPSSRPLLPVDDVDVPPQPDKRRQHGHRPRKHSTLMNHELRKTAEKFL
jgi:DNA-directed RNA polymerase specialized sigma24 family protein